MKVKSPAVAGQFYSNDKDGLLKHLEIFESQNFQDYKNFKTRAIIVPHAGYIYSGQLASCTFQYLDENIKNIFIIAPPHRVPVEGCVLSSFDKWTNPIGEIDVNQNVNNELIEKFGCKFNDEAFTNEHSNEVQIPFIQKKFNNVNIIPILASDSKKVAEIIKYYYSNSENGFVISSDLSHFHSSEDARKLDLFTADMIENNNIDKFNSNLACGAVGILGLLEFIKDNNYSMIRVGLYNSGDVTADKSRVVGYGGWILYEGQKNEFIKKYFSDYIIDICKQSILSKLEEKEFHLKSVPNVFMQSGACFVTLQENNDLRGCIGSIVAHRALIDDLVNNSRSAAFLDPRFKPVEREEFESISIDVSLLSFPEQIIFKDEEDLLSQIRQDVDGIIINDKGKQSVYLPSVWEQLPDKVKFLASLKVKAGLSPTHFSKTFEAFRFTTEYIKA